MITCGRRCLSAKVLQNGNHSIRNFSSITPNSEKELELYSKKKQTSVSIQSLMESGRGDNPNLPTGRATKASEKVLMQVACFLHRELPVRLAHRAVKLESYPPFNNSGKILMSYFGESCSFAHIFFPFHCTVNIRNVTNWYKTSFAQLRACPVPQDLEKEENFARVIESIYERHSSTLITMAKGAHELRNMLNQNIVSFADSNDIQKRLDDFYMSRIGIRMVSYLFNWLRGL